jgi:hypothetical protein
MSSSIPWLAAAAAVALAAEAPEERVSASDAAGQDDGFLTSNLPMVLRWWERPSGKGAP